MQAIIAWLCLFLEPANNGRHLCIVEGNTCEESVQMGLPPSTRSSGVTSLHIDTYQGMHLLAARTMPHPKSKCLTLCPATTWAQGYCSLDCFGPYLLIHVAEHSGEHDKPPYCIATLQGWYCHLRPCKAKHREWLHHHMLSCRPWP